MRKIATIVAAAALASAGVLWGSGATAEEAKTSVAYAIQTHQAQMMILPRFAEKYGVKVELVPMRRYADLQLALTTKQVNFAVIGYVNIGLMEQNGFKDYKAISGVFTGAQSLTLAKGVVAKTWKDLEGKKLGTAPNSYSELLFKATAVIHGADLAKITTVSFSAGGPPLEAALKDHEIDGFVSWEPNNAEAAYKGFGYYSSLDIAANDTKGVNGLLAVDGEYAAKHGKVVAAIVRALVDATNELKAHPEEFADVAQRGTGSSLPIIKESIPHGALDYKLYEPQAEALLKLMYKAGQTKKPTWQAVAEHFDYRWLAAATGKKKAELGGR